MYKCSLIILSLGVVRPAGTKAAKRDAADGTYFCRYCAKPLLVAVRMSRMTPPDQTRAYEFLKKFSVTLLTTEKTDANFFKCPCVA